MKILFTTLAMCLLTMSAAWAADGGKTLASTMDVFVFPTEGQKSDVQSKDEAVCYEWATDHTGNDPFALAKQEQANEEKAQADMQSAQQAGTGRGAGGAIKGAAAGALIGEIANDDASEGAAWGAAAGLVRGRRKAAAQKQQATTQASNQAEQRTEATAEQLENFKKAFSVCLEAKDYMVKF